MKKIIKTIGAALELKISKGYTAKLLVRNYAYFDTLLWLSDNGVSIRIHRSPFKRGLYYYCDLEYNNEKVVCERIEKCKATAHAKWNLPYKS